MITRKIFSYGTRNLFFAFAVVFVLAFVACNPEPEPEPELNPKTYTVTFDINGGSGTAPSAQTVNSGSVITLPGTNGFEKTGFTLGGWNTKADNTGTNSKAGSSYTVTANITLYARWWNNNDTNFETVMGLVEKLAWIEFFAESDEEYAITLNVNENIAPQTVSCTGRTGVTVTLKGDTTARVVSLSSNGPLFSVESGVMLVLDNNITLQGRSNNNVSLIAVNSGGALEMKAGAKITGNTAESDSFVGGGGVAVRDNGTFTMTGGEISGNAVTSDVWAGGGGVIVVGTGTFTMKGGEISGNTASDDGGGVSVHDSGTFTMQGGEISGNSVDADSWANGGGVNVSSGTFTMTGGKIADNTATSDTGSSGGGVSVYQGTFTMSGGEISGNTTSGDRSDGGGVKVDDNGTFIMQGGKISGNTASGNSWAGGSGVEVGGTFTMNGGEISDNTASDADNAGGGGVHVYKGIFTMSGTAKISDNTVTATDWAGGGGVFVGGGTFTMNDGTISGNTATADDWTDGGGVFVDSEGTFHIVTGTVYGSDEGANSNTALGGAALTNNKTAQRGTFNGTTWTSKGDLETTNDTIKVVNGELQ